MSVTVITLSSQDQDLLKRIITLLEALLRNGKEAEFSAVVKAIA